MKVRVTHKEENHELEVNNKAVVKDVLKELDIPANTVIIVRNGNLILEDEKLQDNDEIKLLPTISGG